MKIHLKNLQEIITGNRRIIYEKFENILEGNYKPYPQKGIGTYHSKSDLPKEFSGWHSLIDDEIKRLVKIKYETKKII